jgi:hypothetical protein
MIEKREAERYLVQQGEFFVCASGDKKILGTVLDISLSGLSFWYPLEAIMYDENGKLDILQRKKGIVLKNIPYRNCYDFEVNQSKHLSSFNARRRGIQFQSSLCDANQFECVFGMRAIAFGR